MQNSSGPPPLSDSDCQGQSHTFKDVSGLEPAYVSSRPSPKRMTIYSGSSRLWAAKGARVTDFGGLIELLFLFGELGLSNLFEPVAESLDKQRQFFRIFFVGGSFGDLVPVGVGELGTI
jgi:hypothetical protein